MTSNCTSCIMPCANGGGGRERLCYFLPVSIILESQHFHVKHSSTQDRYTSPTKSSFHKIIISCSPSLYHQEHRVERKQLYVYTLIHTYAFNHFQRLKIKCQGVIKQQETSCRDFAITFIQSLNESFQVTFKNNFKIICTFTEF